MIRRFTAIVITAILWSHGMGWGQSINKNSGGPGESALQINNESFDKPDDRREAPCQDGVVRGTQQGENSGTLDNNLKLNFKAKKSTKRAQPRKKVKTKLTTSLRPEKDVFGLNEPIEKNSSGISRGKQSFKSEFQQFIEQYFDEQPYAELDDEEKNEEILKKRAKLFAREDPKINVEKDDREDDY